MFRGIIGNHVVKPAIIGTVITSVQHVVDGTYRVTFSGNVTVPVAGAAWPELQADDGTGFIGADNVQAAAANQVTVDWVTLIEGPYTWQLTAAGTAVTPAVPPLVAPESGITS